MKIKIVSIPDCPATPPTISLIEETAKEMRIEIEVQQVVCNTSDEANDHRLLGSPTIQINGLDIEPGSRAVTQFGIT